MPFKVVASAVIGSVLSNSASKKAAKAQNDATAAQGAIAERQLALGDRQFAYQKEIGEKQMALAERQALAQTDLGERQMALSTKQDGRADEQWKRYKQTYQPLEDQMVEEAQGAGSIANQSKAASDSAAAVSASFASAKERLAKNPGVNPSSQQFLQEQSKIGLAEAATSAAAQTGAREAVKDRGVAMKTNAVSLGKGLPASAFAGGVTASSMLGAASGAYGQPGTSYSGASSAFGSPGSSFAGAGTSYGNIGTSARQAGGDANASAAGIGKMVGGIFENRQVQDWFKGFGGSVNQGGAGGSGGWAGTPQAGHFYGTGGTSD